MRHVAVVIAGSCLGLVTLAGCAKGVDNGFGSFTASVSVGTSQSTTIGGDGSETTGDEGITSSISGDGSGSSEAGSSSGVSASDSADASTSGVDAGESTTDPDTTGANTSNTSTSTSTSTSSSTSNGESTDTGGNGGQPTDGMYSHCTMANNTCVAPANICINTGDDGFCSADGCANPGADCDASPGGTATPMCVPAPPDYSFCALDCSGGKTCPAGMTCQLLTFDMITDYEMCM